MRVAIDEEKHPQALPQPATKLSIKMSELINLKLMDIKKKNRRIQCRII